MLQNAGSHLWRCWMAARGARASLSPLGALFLLGVANLAGPQFQTTAAATSAHQTVATWGGNGNGQLGVSFIDEYSTIPHEILERGALTGKTITQVVAGAAHNFALCSDGTIGAWGQNNNGELGDGTTNTTSLPIDISSKGALNGKTVVEIAAGLDHSLAFCSDGTVAAWGDNNFGGIGDGTTTQRNLPVNITGRGKLRGKTVTHLVAGVNRSLALCSDGSVVDWGRNDSGQLGDGTVVNRLSPVLVLGGALLGKKVVEIATGDNHTLALCSNGNVVVWGGDFVTGGTVSHNLPVDITANGALNGKTVTKLAGGATHSLALCSDGTVLAWGINIYGQLGDGTTTNRYAPMAVTGGALKGKKVVQMVAGGDHSAALCSDGSVITWGGNEEGVLGDGTWTNRTLPMAITTQGALYGVKVTQIAAGYYHNVALATDQASPTVVTLPPSASSQELLHKWW